MNTQVRDTRPPKQHPPMDTGKRAKQFAPFAALGSLDNVLQDIVCKHDYAELEHVENLEDFNYICMEDSGGSFNLVCAEEQDMRDIEDDLC